MNIFDLRINKQALSEMAVLHPVTGEPTGMVVSVRSVDHPKVQVALTAFYKANAKGDDAEEKTIEEQLAANAESSLELAVAMTDSWTVVGADGNKLPDDADGVRIVLSDDELSWLRDGIAAHGLARKNYFRGAPARAGSVGSAGRVAKRGAGKAK